MRPPATSADQLAAHLAEPEGAQLEFKEAKGDFSKSKVLDICVALGNSGGGRLILGVTDTRPRRIVGTAAFAEPGIIEHELDEKLRHPIAVEELRLPEGRVLIFHIPPRARGTALDHDGKYLKRSGEAIVPMTHAELRAIFAEAGPDFSAELCPRATVADLSPEAVARLRERWADKTGDDRKRRWSDEETLANAELVVAGQVTWAALILCGTHAALGRHLGQAELVFEYRASEASGPAADRIAYREGFFLWTDELWRKIALRNDLQSYQDGFFRRDIPTFDESSVRELVLNAVAHRDYRQGGNIFVRQFRDRLEVTSPGGLPEGVTPQNILDQQQPRNRRLAQTLERCGLVERSGQGLNLVYESAIRQGKALPDFTGTDDHRVQVILEGQLRHPAFVRYLEKIESKTQQSFSTKDFLVLDHVFKGQKLDAALQGRVQGLLAAGVLEKAGRKLILSRSLYRELGQPGAYTRRRGLDHETKKALLEKHLQDAGAQGAVLSELHQVLPEENIRNVQRLLNELKQEQRVVLVGQRRIARWFHPAFIRQNPEGT